MWTYLGKWLFLCSALRSAITREWLTWASYTLAQAASLSACLPQYHRCRLPFVKIGIMYLSQYLSVAFWSRFSWSYLQDLVLNFCLEVSFSQTHPLRMIWAPPLPPTDNSEETAHWGFLCFDWPHSRWEATGCSGSVRCYP